MVAPFKVETRGPREYHVWLANLRDVLRSESEAVRPMLAKAAVLKHNLVSQVSRPKHTPQRNQLLLLPAPRALPIKPLRNSSPASAPLWQQQQQRTDRAVLR